MSGVNGDKNRAKRRVKVVLLQCQPLRLVAPSRGALFLPAGWDPVFCHFPVNQLLLLLPHRVRRDSAVNTPICSIPGDGAFFTKKHSHINHYVTAHSTLQSYVSLCRLWFGQYLSQTYSSCWNSSNGYLVVNIYDSCIFNSINILPSNFSLKKTIRLTVSYTVYVVYN